MERIKKDKNFQGIWLGNNLFPFFTLMSHPSIDMSLKCFPNSSHEITSSMDLIKNCKMGNSSDIFTKQNKCYVFTSMLIVTQKTEYKE